MKTFGGLVVYRTTLVLMALSAFADASAAGPIDLDLPANVQAVQRDRPDHYAKIERILAEAPARAMDTKGLPRWLQTDFAASDVRYTDVLMTSLPPKKRLEFSLDNVSYTKIIQVDSRGEVVRTLVQAARSGDCRAARRLGEIYQRGNEGVAADAAEAAKWFNAARTLGCDVPISGGR